MAPAPGASRRRKGHDGERELARLLAQALGDRTIARNLGQEREGGFDIAGRALRHFAVEAKVAETPRWSEWLNQAREQAGELRIPVLARREGGRWRFLVELDLVGGPVDFDRLVRFVNLLQEGRHP